MFKDLWKILLLLFPLFGAGQSAEKVELVGTLETEDKQLISIKLQFTTDPDGTIHGTSVTDFYGADRTISAISGHYDRDKELLSFKEVSNVSTRSDVSTDRFCFVQVKDLPIKKRNDKSIINGKFTGKFPDGTDCAEGYIYLVGNQILQEVARDIVPLLPSEYHPDSLMNSYIQGDALNASNKTVLGNKDVIDLSWHSDMIQILLMDSFDEDGDKVNIYINDARVHSALEIKESWQVLKESISGDTTLIRIEAENEGSNPPNTVQVRLKDEQKSYPFISKLKKGEAITIMIRKQI